MKPEARTNARIRRIAREEADLAARASDGDRIAFDALFDRYCARMAHFFRALPHLEAKAKIWEALEQVFAGLACDSVTPLALRAFRVAKATDTSRMAHSVRASTHRARSSRYER